MQNVVVAAGSKSLDMVKFYTFTLFISNFIDYRLSVTTKIYKYIVNKAAYF